MKFDLFVHLVLHSSMLQVHLAGLQLCVRRDETPLKLLKLILKLVLILSVGNHHFEIFRGDELGPLEPYHIFIGVWPVLFHTWHRAELPSREQPNHSSSMYELGPLASHKEFHCRHHTVS